jgi:hypothetical protein
MAQDSCSDRVTGSAALEALEGTRNAAMISLTTDVQKIIIHSMQFGCKGGNFVPVLNTSEMCHEDIWGSGGIAPHFLSSALHGSECSASRPWFRCK